MNIGSDVIIVGAGVLGVSLAYHLGRRGVRALVLEREATYATHASGRNAGMVRQLYRHPQLTEWANRSLNCWPADVRRQAFRRTGSLVVGREVPGHHRSLFEQRCIKVDGEGTPAVYAAEDGLLDPADHISGLFSLSNKDPVRYLFGAEVLSIRKSGFLWSVILADGRIFSAPWIVNAAGAWVNDFLFSHYGASAVSVNPYARHLFLVHGWKRDFMPQQDLGFYWDEKSEWYMRLWDKRTRLVSICDRIPADPGTYAPRADIGESVANKLIAVLPEEQYEELQLGRSWHCFRTYTEDQLPIWGEDPALEGLFWLAAFGGFGMSTSFAAAEDAALYICGEEVLVADDFLPARVQTFSTRTVNR
ncbi:MAG: FAD-binding oxidoreductase [Bdellovibrionales bacterium]|nr:FAD-binding oxidoreductase [Bdellovibrionales bacterium]